MGFALTNSTCTDCPAPVLERRFRPHPEWSHHVGLLALTDEKVDKPGTRNITAVDQAVIRRAAIN